MNHNPMVSENIPLGPQLETHTANPGMTRGFDPATVIASIKL